MYLTFFFLLLILKTLYFFHFQAGPYWVSLIDSYAASFALLLFGICETIGLAWFYGIKRFTNDIRTMIGNGYVDFIGFKWWPLLWGALTPAILIVRDKGDNLITTRGPLWRTKWPLIHYMNWSEPRTKWPLIHYELE